MCYRYTKLIYNIGKNFISKEFKQYIGTIGICKKTLQIGGYKDIIIGTDKL